MKADMGRRYRLYPTLGQTERLTGWGHTCRAVWNVALAQRQFVYGQRGTRLRAAGQCRDLTEARAELDWLANLPAQSGQQILAHLDRAYDNLVGPEASRRAAEVQEAPQRAGGALPRAGGGGTQVEQPVGGGAAAEAWLGPVPPIASTGWCGEKRHRVA
jgi:Helix-turn-helix domain